MKLKLGGTLEIGDPVLISCSSGFDFAIFAGYGANTVQYYMVNYILHSNEESIKTGLKPKFWKSYVYGTNIQYRVVKVTPEILYNIDDLDAYNEAIKILTNEKIIK